MENPPPGIPFFSFFKQMGQIRSRGRRHPGVVPEIRRYDADVESLQTREPGCKVRPGQKLITMGTMTVQNHDAISARSSVMKEIPVRLPVDSTPIFETSQFHGKSSPPGSKIRKNRFDDISGSGVRHGAVGLIHTVFADQLAENRL